MGLMKGLGLRSAPPLLGMPLLLRPRGSFKFGNKRGTTGMENRKGRSEGVEVLAWAERRKGLARSCELLVESLLWLGVGGQGLNRG